MLRYKLNYIPHGKIVYYSGEIIQGAVELTMYNETHINEISVKIVGKSKAKVGSRYCFKTLERYIDHKIELYDHNSDELMISGSYKYSFDYKLPVNLPQSTINNDDHKETNNIIYYCKLRINIKNDDDEVQKYPFIVKRHDDLNCFPILRSPVTQKRTKKYNFFFQKLVMSATIPQAGYAPGQRIPIIIKYNNKTNDNIESTSVRLEAWKCLKTRICGVFCISSDVQREILLTKSTIGVAANETAEFEYDFHVPDDVDSSDILFSKSIKIKHYIKVIANFEGCIVSGYGPCIVLPIVIGTVPLLDDTEKSVENTEDNPEIINHLTNIDNRNFYVYTRTH